MRLLLRIVLQTLMAFGVILLYTRILGKQQISQLTYYDYINGITLGSIAAVMATDVEHVTWQHFVSLTIFAVLTYLSTKLSLKSRSIRKMLEGEPVPLIQHGKILEDNLRKTNFSIDNLMSQLRQQNIFSAIDVEFATLESNGQLSILLDASKQPLTPSDIALDVQKQSPSSELIIDGQLVSENLKQYKLSTEWLQQTIASFNISNIKQVAYMSINQQGHIYVDRYDDKLVDYVETSDKQKKTHQNS